MRRSHAGCVLPCELHTVELEKATLSLLFGPLARWLLCRARSGGPGAEPVLVLRVSHARLVHAVAKDGWSGSRAREAALAAIRTSRESSLRAQLAALRGRLSSAPSDRPATPQTEASPRPPDRARGRSAQRAADDGVNGALWPPRHALLGLWRASVATLCLLPPSARLGTLLTRLGAAVGTVVRLPLRLCSLALATPALMLSALVSTLCRGWARRCEARLERVDIAVRCNGASITLCGLGLATRLVAPTEITSASNGSAERGEGAEGAEGAEGGGGGALRSNQTGATAFGVWASQIQVWLVPCAADGAAECSAEGEAARSDGRASMLRLTSVEQGGRRRAALALGIELRGAKAGGAPMSGVDVGLGDVDGERRRRCLARPCWAGLGRGGRGGGVEGGRRTWRLGGTRPFAGKTDGATGAR